MKRHMKRIISLITLAAFGAFSLMSGTQIAFAQVSSAGTTTSATASSTATSTGTATSTASTTQNMASTTATTTGGVSVMVMTHICGSSIKTPTDFQAIQQGLDPIAALAETVKQCPTTGLTGDQAAPGALSSPRTSFGYTVTKGTSTQTLANATFEQHKLCESDINRDVDGSGTIASSTCLDISHYMFNPTASSSSGTTSPIFVVLNAPLHTHLGALKFTPNELSANNDAAALTNLSLMDQRIDLDPSSDTDRMIMLHIYAFVDSGTTTATSTSGTSTGTSTATSSHTGTGMTGSTTPGSVRIMIMKHLCGPSITSADELDEVAGMNTDNMATKFLNAEIACPVTGLSGDTPPSGTNNTKRSDFDITLSMGNSSSNVMHLSHATYVPWKICESDGAIDVNHDGVVSSSTCYDASYYVFPSVSASAGKLTITEVEPTMNTHIGAVHFTPAELQPNNDQQSFVAIDTDTDSGNIVIDPSKDTDGMIMLHVFNVWDTEDHGGNGNNDNADGSDDYTDTSMDKNGHYGNHGYDNYGDSRYDSMDDGEWNSSSSSDWSNS